MGLGRRSDTAVGEWGTPWLTTPTQKPTVREVFSTSELSANGSQGRRQEGVAQGRGLARPVTVGFRDGRQWEKSLSLGATTWCGA